MSIKKTVETVDTTAGGVAQTVGRFTDTQLSEVNTLDDALRLLADAGADVEAFEDFGSGFEKVEKDTLIGTPMLLIEWRVLAGDEGPYVHVTAITDTNRQVRFSDGSDPGIYGQLTEIADRRSAAGKRAPSHGLTVKKGLKVSTYQRKHPQTRELMFDTSGKPLMSSTYYIA